MRSYGSCQLSTRDVCEQAARLGLGTATNKGGEDRTLIAALKNPVVRGRQVGESPSALRSVCPHGLPALG